LITTNFITAKMAFKPNSKFNKSVGFKIKIFSNPTKLASEKNLLNSRKLQIIVLINNGLVHHCQSRL